VTARAGRILYGVLLGITLLVYAVMILWSLPTVAQAAGGLPPFDMRPGGYSLEDARLFLNQLSSEGAAFYQAVQLRLDAVYPPLISLTLFFSLASLLPNQLGVWRWVLPAPVLAITAFDYLENASIASMISAGPLGLTTEIVNAASRWTVLKSNLTTAAMTSVIILVLIRLAIHGARRWRAEA
jgi:hypothetical protein